MLNPIRAGMTRTKQKQQSGFTLIEISIVIVLMASIISSVAVIFTSQLERIQREETLAKIKAIKEALYTYRVAFNELPCPADITLPIGNTHFGVMAANKGTCTGGVPAANFSGTGTAQRAARGGMVPTRTLQLPDDYAFDGWGRRMKYVVTRDLTQEGAFNIVSGISNDTRMTILNEQGGINTFLAAYVIVSGGENGHGAFPRAGGAARVNSGSVNVDELNNCDCTSNVVATALDERFVQKSPQENPANILDSYDDIVDYATRFELMLESSLSWSLGPQFTFEPGLGSDPGGELPSSNTGGGAGPGGGEDPICTPYAGIGCFPAGTMITTPNGQTPIEAIRRGDLVIAVDTKGNTSTVVVEGTITKENKLIEIHTAQGILQTTRDHPIWISADEYREAGKLNVGDSIMMWDTNTLRPTHIIRINAASSEQHHVFNLDVAAPHTFIANGIIVHNKSIARCLVREAQPVMP